MILLIDEQYTAVELLRKMCILGDFYAVGLLGHEAVIHLWPMPYQENLLCLDLPSLKQNLYARKPPLLTPPPHPPSREENH